MVSDSPAEVIAFFANSFTLSDMVVNVTSTTFCTSARLEPSSTHSLPNCVSFPIANAPPISTPIFFTTLPSPLKDCLIADTPFCTPDVSILVSIMTEPSAAMCPPPNYLRFNISFSASLYACSSSLRRVFISIMFLFS